MPSHLLRAIILYFMTLSITVIQMPASQSATTDFRYQNCSHTFQCGNISDIGYPFWGSNRPDYCGYPGFELNCTTDQAPFMKIKDLTYRVLEIDNGLGIQTLKLARTDYTEDVCVPFLHNTTLDLNLFNYTSDTQNITVYYGCPIMPDNLAATPGLSSPFDCNINMSTVEGYYVTRGLSSFGLPADPIRKNLQKCNISVIIPAYQPAIQSLESNATQANLIPTLAQGFKLQWSTNDSLCSQCRTSGGECGYNQTTESFACYCPYQPSNTTCSTDVNYGHEIGLPMAGIVIIIFATVLGICLGCCLLIVIQRRKRIAARTKMEAFIRNYHSLVPKRYSYSDVKKMTNSFTDKLGRGGFGDVYKGTLPDGHLVAVKLLKKSNGDGEEFINEVASISRTSHVNIVNLLGFCYGRTKRALIYEYMRNGSLDKFIFNRGSTRTEQVLDWRTLYEISIGIARGLEYLHRGCNTRIVHFDIKPHNILLDEDFCPKISDFGLAKLCKTKESKVSMLAARGTAGYIAPEVFFRNYGGVSYKSDVYSYGMMVLEMVGGRNKMDARSDASEMFFPDWLYKQLEPRELSLVHGAITEEEEEVVKKMILVGLWCIQTNPSDRPSMTKVVEMLEGSLESLQIPPKPFLSSPTRSPQMYSSAMWSQSSAEEKGSAALVHDQE